jgi:selenocysteine lyase/cysteine desulfurase
MKPTLRIPHAGGGHWRLADPGRVASKNAFATGADRRGALVCIAPTDASALVSVLAEDGIVTSERDGNLRVSAHAYNVEEDVDAVLASLERHRVLLR